MHTNTKAKPKSCSCSQCIRGKASEAGKAMKRADERAYRHSAKQLLRKFVDDTSDTPLPAPQGNYYD